MYCSKCGKEIMDEAVICPNCGCPTSNYSAIPTTQNTTKTYSKEYPIIKEFVEKANSIQTLGIIATVLMFGIGIIFSILVWVKASQITIPDIETTNPKEVAEIESAKRKVELGKKLAMFPVVAIFVCGFIVLAAASSNWGW